MRRHHLPLQQPMGQSSPHGVQKRWHMAALRWLPPTQRRHSAGQVPNPNILDMAAKLSGCTVFSKLDLCKGYYQIQVAAADMQKTAVITPVGLFEFTRMMCGLRNAGQSFQRLMDSLKAALPVCCLCVFRWPDCSQHAGAAVDFLGHRISVEGATRWWITWRQCASFSSLLISRVCSVS
jgi:hypothetical protein